MRKWEGRAVNQSQDRGFHLSISVVAIFVTMVSVLSIINQCGPAMSKVEEQVDGVWHSLASHATHLSGIARSVVHDGSRVPATLAAAMPHKVVSASGSKALANIHVVAVGSDTTAKQVQHVEQLIQRVGVLSIVSHTVGMSLQKPVTIEIADDESDYQAALQKLAMTKQSAANLAEDTGGFTQNSTIVIPMDQNQSEGDLANTLTHEMTHVVFNQNIGTLPSWLNEGIAVFDGMQGQKQVESAVTFAGDERQLAETILDVAQKHQLQPLFADEQVILDGKTSYDYELQDWLAVSDLVSQHGLTAIQDDLQMMQQHVNESTAFIRAFGQPESTFNASLTALLNKASTTKNQGVQLQCNVTQDFTGELEILPQGTTNWQGLDVSDGQYSIGVQADGKLSGQFKTLPVVKDNNGADARTLYISLLPKQPETYQGKKVINSGFAFDVHDGLYAFENAWVSLKDGQTIYTSTPSLFGVSITGVREAATGNALLPLFAAQEKVSN